MGRVGTDEGDLGQADGRLGTGEGDLGQVG